jgi:hypothetical protein
MIMAKIIRSALSALNLRRSDKTYHWYRYHHM